MNKKVYVGVGHGGADNGAIGYIIEDETNLKMAIAIKAYLEAHGVDVKISRTKDIDSSIASKVAEANAWKADLALDVHNNAGGGEGAEVYHSIVGGVGKTLANNILTELTKIGQKSRGAKTREENGADYFGFIRMTDMPAVITECVFVDSKTDAAKADTDAECKVFGEAIARGVLTTLGIKDKGVKTPIYRVQIGAFKSKSNAERYVAALKSKGIDAFVVKGGVK